MDDSFEYTLLVIMALNKHIFDIYYDTKYFGAMVLTNKIQYATIVKEERN